MLSYLKDGAGKGAGESNQPEAPEQSGEDFLTTAHHGRSAKQGTMILTVLFVAGAVVVWFMIKKVAPAPVEAAAETDEGARIEQFLAQLDSFKSEVNGQMNTMFSRFYQASELGQIRADELKKNPFRLEMNIDPEVVAPKDLTEARLQILEEEVNRQAGRLQLWSVTERATNPCCMINEKVLYVGDTIEGFTIKAIRVGRVILERDGVQVELKMQE